MKTMWLMSVLCLFQADCLATLEDPSASAVDLGESSDLAAVLHDFAACEICSSTPDLASTRDLFTVIDLFALSDALPCLFPDLLYDLTPSDNKCGNINGIEYGPCRPYEVCDHSRCR